METQERARKIINYILESTGLTQDQISKKAGYAPQSLTQMLSKGEVSKTMLKNIEREFSEVLKNSIQPESVVNEPKQPKWGNDIPLTKKNMQRILDDNHTLIESHRRSIENERIALENNTRSLELSKKLVDANNQMFKELQSTESARRQTAIIDDANFQAIRELLLEVGSGKRFVSLEQVEARLGKLVSEALDREKGKGTRIDSGS